MRGETAEKIEQATMTSAAAVFAAAIGFAAFSSLATVVPGLAVTALVMGAGAVAYLLCRAALARVGSNEPQFLLPEFDPCAVKSEPPDVLELAEAEILQSVPPTAAEDGALELDDILHELAPDARVVRLFDPAKMPTPAELKSRIDRHLKAGSNSSPDASQALVEALTELRRSLR
jgi:hypothetical protein